MGYKEVLDEMKAKNIPAAVMKRNEGLLYSTFQLDDPLPQIAQYLSNNAQLLMMELGDEAKEIEISMENKMLVIFPAETHIILGLVSTKEEKKLLREYTGTLKLQLM